MNPLLTRRYSPAEFHNLSKAEAEEMKELSFSRVEYDRFRLARAHGDLCTGLIHLGRAKVYFQEHKPEIATPLGGIMARLSKLIPSYGEFSAAMRSKKGLR